jgi:Tfp pilus assembly PilM family ATPase
LKVLGLDIGSHSIKAVELDVSFGRVELSEYFIEPVVEPREEPKEPELKPEGAEKKKEEFKKASILSKGQLLAIRSLFQKHIFNVEKISINHPKGWTTSRVLNFPVKDRKTIQNSLTFELEDEIPFDQENAVIDFGVLKTEGNSSKVFTSVVMKSDLTELLSQLQLLGIDPDMVTIEAWSITSLLRRAVPPGFADKPMCIVNLGASQTTIHIFNGPEPVLTHVTSCGGDSITHAIASEYSLSLEEAEKAKVDGAFLITQTHLDNTENITEDQKHFSSIIEVF